MDQKEFEQLVELGKNAVLLTGVVVASAVGAYKSIKTQLKPITQELTLEPATPPYASEENPTLKATAVRIEDRVRGLEDSFKEVIATQLNHSKKFESIDIRVNDIHEQTGHIGDHMNLMQEQINTIHRHLLNNGRPH